VTREPYFTSNTDQKQQKDKRGKNYTILIREQYKIWQKETRWKGGGAARGKAQEGKGKHHKACLSGSNSENAGREEGEPES